MPNGRDELCTCKGNYRFTCGVCLQKTADRNMADRNLNPRARVTVEPDCEGTIETQRRRH